MARFPARWDRTLRVSTTAAVIVLAGAVAALLWISAATGAPAAVAWAVAALFAATVAATWALAPRGFAVEAGAVRVERPLRPVAIPLRDVRSAGPLPANALRGALRLGGSGGMFGYYGRYWSRSLGAFRLYATRRDALVRVDTGQERFVLSPEAPERFLAEVLAHAPHAAAGEGAPAPPRRVSRRTKLALAAAVAVVPLGAGAVLLASQAQAPVAARLSAEAVVVERRWTGDIVIPIATIRSARVLSPADLRGLRRVAGYSGREVHYGRFRSDTLGEFRLYAWLRGPAVLLETEGRPVVLTPEDPAGFAADVEHAIGARGR